MIIDAHVITLLFQYVNEQVVQVENQILKQ